MKQDPSQSWRRPGDPPEVILFIRSLLFWIGLLLSTLIIATSAILVAPFSFRVRYRFINQWARVNLWWLWVTCRLKGEVTGQEHIPSGSAVLFSKHQSTWETLALQRIFPPLAWVMKRQLLRIPFFGWALALIEPIAIDRRAGRKAVDQVVEQGRDRLQQGRWVMVFPEGTRVPPGKRGRYRVGGAVLAEHSGFPVLPVAHNAGEYWPRHQFIKRPGIIRMRIGPAIDPQGKSAQEILKAAEDWIEGAMPELSTRPELYAQKGGAERVETIPSL